MTSRARTYVGQLAIAAPERSPTRDDRLPVFTDGRQAVVVGAQLAEFTDQVPPDIRGDVSNWLLLAQLAADKATETSGDVFRWQDTYIDVLQQTGWRLDDVSFREQRLDDSAGELHEAIIPLVALAFGPAASAASIVLSILNSLQTMQQDTPWMTVFSRKSQHLRGAKFQVGLVDAGPQGEPKVALACFAMEASQTITQVLFFKLSQQAANLQWADSAMTITPDALNDVRDAVRSKVNSQIVLNIKNIEI
jgi:hypothetical protein